MLHKATIYWASAVGVAAAAGVGGVIWHMRGGDLAGRAPVQVIASAPPAAGAGDRTVALPPARAPQSVVASAPPVVVEPPPASKEKISAQNNSPPPQFDIVRVEATGEAVIAGHAAPNAKISVTDHGQVVAEADADATGQFVVLPPTFAPGGHALGLSARAGASAPIQSPGIVGVDVPQQPAPAPRLATHAIASAASPAPAPAPAAAAAMRQTVASPTPALAARIEAARPVEASAARSMIPVTTVAAESSIKPGGPLVAAKSAASPPFKAAEPLVLAKAEAPAPAASPPIKPAEPIILAKAEAPIAAAPPRTIITGVAADEAGRMVTTGQAAPGASLRLYLNGSFLANVTAGARGLWSLTVEHGMTGGAYAIRADEIDRAKDIVISRAEVPFSYPKNVGEQTIIAKPSSPQLAGAASAPLAAATPDQPRAIAAPPGAAQTASETPSPASFARDLAGAGAAPTPAAVPAPAAQSLAAAPLADAPSSHGGAVEAAASQQTSTLAEPRDSHVDAAVTSAQREAAANAVVRVIDTHKVIPGDNLWDISQALYGNGLRYTQIYAANANQIRNPRLIYPGQIFVLPQPTPF